jgi:hypothetical protein
MTPLSYIRFSLNPPTTFIHAGIDQYSPSVLHYRFGGINKNSRKEASMYKQYKLEFGLGLGGAIAGIMAFIYTLLFTFIFLFGFSVGSIPIIIGLTFMLAAFIIAFVGAARLNQNRKSGAVYLLVSAGLTIASVVLSFDTAWFGLLIFPLTLTAGLLAILKKTPAKNKNKHETHVNSLDFLK